MCAIKKIVAVFHCEFWHGGKSALSKVTLASLWRYYWLYLFYVPLIGAVLLSKDGIRSEEFAIFVILSILVYSGFAAGFSLIDILLSFRSHRLLRNYESVQMMSPRQTRHILQHLLNQPTPNFSGLLVGALTGFSGILPLLLRAQIEGEIYFYVLAAILLIVVMGAQTGAHQANQQQRDEWIRRETALMIAEETNASPTHSRTPTTLGYTVLIGIID